MALRTRLLATAMTLALLAPFCASTTASAAAVPALRTPTATAPTATRQRAGDTKTQCAYTAHSISALQSFSAAVGHPIDCAVVFTDNATTWQMFEQPWLLGGGMADHHWASWLQARPGRRLIVTQSLVPIGLPANWRSAGAHGAYDNHIRAWAANLVAAGLGSATVRLGHEANGDWYFDSVGTTAKDSADWAAYWARFVRVARSIPGAHFLFDWTVNAGYRQVPFAQFYPGDGVVDIIGVDQYDGLAFAPRRLPTTGAGRWAAVQSQAWGLSTVVAFAAEHGKPLSLPEWGLMTAGAANGTGGGDDAAFVNGIASIVRHDDVSYESVWDRSYPAAAQVPFFQDSPAAMAAYRKHFGRGGDALSPAASAWPRASAAHPAAAPAVSHLTPCQIWMQTPSAAVQAGSRVRVIGRLVDTAGIVAGQSVVLERLVGKHWSLVSRAVTDLHGTVVMTPRPGATTLYRLRFAAAAGRQGSTSVVLTVDVSRHR